MVDVYSTVLQLTNTKVINNTKLVLSMKDTANMELMFGVKYD